MMPETSFKCLPRAFAVFAVALLAMCALGGVMASEESSAAVDTGSQSSPLSSLSIDANKITPVTFYVKVGGSVSVTFTEYSQGTGAYNCQSVTPGYGLTIKDSGQLLSGTLSKAGTVNVAYILDRGHEILNLEFTIVSVKASTPVTSISISGASSVNAGSSITLSASVSPSDATNKSVTWSVQSGSSYVTISPNGTSCTVTGKAAGEAIIKCTANDSSGISATKRILVTSSGSSLPDGVSSGSGTSSDPYVFNLSAGTNYSLKVQPVGQFTSYAAVSDPVTVPGMTFSTTAGGSVTTLTSLSGGQLGAMTISGTPTTNGTWDINATNPSATKYYRIVVTGGNNGFTLHYDANGGSGAPSDATYTSSSSTYTAQVSSVKPTKTGHTFLGWSKSSTAATATFQSGANITLSPGTTTLYAVWQEVKQDWFAYLYYNANGGSGAPSTQSDSINAASPSGSKTFTISSAKPTKS